MVILMCIFQSSTHFTEDKAWEVRADDFQMLLQFCHVMTYNCHYVGKHVYRHTEQITKAITSTTLKKNH